MPPTKLTPHLARTLGEPGVRSEHFDSLVRGLSLRVSASGARSWCFVYSRAGRAHRVTLGSVRDVSLADARERAKAERRKVDDGRNPAMERRAARTHATLTVGSLVAQMLDRIRLRPSTKKEWARLAAVDLAPLSERPTADVTRGEVRLWLDGISKRSGWTANHAFTVLRRAYSWGLEMELVGASPCIGLKKPYQGEASERVLSQAEVRALWRALSVLGEGQYPDAVRLLLLTGTRRAMVLGARRGEYTSDAGDDAAPFRRAKESSSTASPAPSGAWTIPGGFTGRSKSGRAHVVPLSPQAAAVVRRRLEQSRDYLFPTFYIRRKDQEPSPHMLALPGAWIRSLKAATIWQLRRELGHGLRAKMARWHLHNLRHTIATLMVEHLGVDEAVADLILGHTPPGRRGAAGVYQRAQRLPERRAALNLWGQWVEGIAAEKSNVLPMAAPRAPGKRGE